MVIVTGAAGFIGARLVEALGARGVAVMSVDAFRHFGARPEHRDIDFGERVDVDALSSRLAHGAEKPQAIVHLGAITDTRETDRALLSRMNVEFSKHLWQHAAVHGVPLIYASSAATYGDGTLGYDDDEAVLPALKPLNAYGESKQAFDVWALSRETAGEHPPAWCGLKFFNVYGFGERHKGAMASVVLQSFDQIQRTGAMRLFRSHRPGIADGYQARDFIFVDDVVDVIVGLIEAPVSRGIFNLGTGKARTFLDLVRAVFAALNVPERVEFVDTPASIRDQYQYFTEARMTRLAAAGHGRTFTTLESGVTQYVLRLLRDAQA